MSKQGKMESAVRLFNQGRTREQLAKQFKVSVGTIDNWREKVGIKPDPRARAATAHRKIAKADTVLVRLQKENYVLRQLAGKVLLDLYLESDIPA